ncbi:MAG TPA: M1 family aminopeptidase [Vicinamibacterales bacterium]|nr:M1 family aminopeptidase [Vicinamibacterales bacterium]
MRIRLAAIAVVSTLAFVLGTAAPVRAQDDQIERLLRRLEELVQTNDTVGYVSLLTGTADAARARDFLSTEFAPGVEHAVIQERDRTPLANMPAGNGHRIMVDVFADFGPRARIATWRLDIVRAGAAGAWRINDEERISSVESVYRVALNTTKQYTAHNLKISAEDIDLSLQDGSVFVAEAEGGSTALVLFGHGLLNFHPAPETEQGQVRIFCGREALEAKFDTAFIRLNPADFETFVSTAALELTPVDQRLLRRAQAVFNEESGKSFAIDLGDLSRDAWSLLPGIGDFLAEIRTRKYDTLTYTHSSNEAEDISFFDRRHKHNIALYASREQLAKRGRFYTEDDLVDYDILDYDVDVAYTPERYWLNGRTTLKLKVRAFGIGTLNLRLADSLVVESIVSKEFGRLFGIRVKNQNMLVVNLPTMVGHDSTMTVTVTYNGRLEPQSPDRETAGLQPPGQAVAEDLPMVAAERSYLYSSRTYWYPQAPYSDYATARIRLNVPAGVDCVASGTLARGFPAAAEPADGASKDPALARKVYQFNAAQPLRYLSFIVSRFEHADERTVTFPSKNHAGGSADGAMPGTSYGSLNIDVEANPRQVSKGREIGSRAADIASFYESIMGDCPYDSFTIALIESDLPGGHSPAYFAALNQPLPTSPLVWRNDPAAFSGFSDFFIAHELAHQWWGQAVGWQNYHEQWLSEGFAQYFAALYAQHQRGPDGFASVLRQLRKWAMDNSSQGPVYLGYRLGHIRNDSRVFRALVYNKGAAVLHMLRRLIGDEAFFRGLRRFYRESRFQKTGTESLRAAMEAESGRTLSRFFEQWIYGSSLPKLRVSYRVEGAELVLQIEQLNDVFDVPVSLSLDYGDRRTTVVVPVTERTVERRVKLTGMLHGVDFTKDDGTLAEVEVVKRT